MHRYGRHQWPTSLRFAPIPLNRRHVAVLDVPYALAIGAGMVATVNPCGFAMLPAYLGFFVGTDDGESRALRDRVARALVVSTAMTVGFVTVFGIVGLLVQTVAQSIDDHLSKVTIGIGILLVLLGLWLLTGHELRINGPKLQRGGRDRTLVSMYLFGVSYATASLSCTLGPFLVALTPTFRHSGTASGLLAFVAYALGMGLVVASATVALAGAQQTWITRLRNLGPIINRVSGALLILAGLYVAWYGYWELQGDFAADPIVDGAARIQTWLTNQVADLPRWPLAVVLVLALAAVVLARRRRHPTTAIKGASQQ